MQMLKALVGGILVLASCLLLGEHAGAQITPAQIGQWTDVASWPIVAVHALLMPTGNVLAWTDYTNNAGAQVWRPSTNSFVPATYSAVSLFCAGHTYLADGRILV